MSPSRSPMNSPVSSAWNTQPTSRTGLFWAWPRHAISLPTPTPPLSPSVSTVYAGPDLRRQGFRLSRNDAVEGIENIEGCNQCCVERGVYAASPHELKSALQIDLSWLSNPR